MKKYILTILMLMLPMVTLAYYPNTTYAKIEEYVKNGNDKKAYEIALKTKYIKGQDEAYENILYFMGEYELDTLKDKNKAIKHFTKAANSRNHTSRSMGSINSKYMLFRLSTTLNEAYTNVVKYNESVNYVNPSTAAVEQALNIEMSAYNRIKLIQSKIKDKDNKYKEEYYNDLLDKIVQKENKYFQVISNEAINVNYAPLTKETYRHLIIYYAAQEPNKTKMNEYIEKYIYVSQDNLSDCYDKIGDIFEAIGDNETAYEYRLKAYNKKSDSVDYLVKLYIVYTQMDNSKNSTDLLRYLNEKFNIYSSEKLAEIYSRIADYYYQEENYETEYNYRLMAYKQDPSKLENVVTLLSLGIELNKPEKNEELLGILRNNFKLSDSEIKYAIMDSLTGDNDGNEAKKANENIEKFSSKYLNLK